MSNRAVVRRATVLSDYFLSGMCPRGSVHRASFRSGYCPWTVSSRVAEQFSLNHGIHFMVKWSNDFGWSVKQSFKNATLDNLQENTISYRGGCFLALTITLRKICESKGFYWAVFYRILCTVIQRDLLLISTRS